MAETFIPWRLDDFPGLLWEFDLEAERFTAIHGRFLLGYSLEQWLEPGFWGRLIHPEDRARIMSASFAAIAQGEDHMSEYRVVTADAQVLWIRDFARVFRARGRAVAKGMMLDVTARFHAEERRLEAEHRLKAVLDSYDGSVVLFDAEGRIRDLHGRAMASSDVAKVFASTPVAGKTLPELLGPELAQLHQDALQRALGGQTVEYAYASALASGAHYLVRFSPALDGRGRCLGAMAVVHDDTARIERERKLSYQTALLHELTETSPDGILVTDREGRIRMHNERLRVLLRLGPGDLVGRSTEDDQLFAMLRYPEEVRQRAGALIKDPEGTHSGEMDLVDGRILEWYSAPVSSEKGAFDGRVLFLRDVTRRRMLEVSLRRSEQLASLGFLAASVAHEMNNPLSYAATNVGFAVEELGRLLARGHAGTRSLEELSAALRDAQDGLARVATIVRELKNFSREEPEAPDATCPREVIQSAVRLVRPQIVSRAQLVVSARDGRKVVGGAQKLVQVVVNLLVNAAHAIPSGAADERRIEVGTAPSDDGRIELFVQDDGAGIHPEVLPRIFDPFFTTKPQGVGTGLGLAVCHRIVDGYGGELQVLTEPGRGTRVRVLLKPAASA